MEKRLGLVGTGQMGLPMGLRWLDQGYELSIFDIRREAMDPLIRRGARAAQSPAEVASQASTVLVSLPTPAAVQEVVLGPEGLIHGSKMTTYVDLSTTGLTVARQVAARLSEKGVTVLDAPVSGGVPGAEKGSLTVMVSGPHQALEELRPALEVIGKNVVFVSEKPGLAQMMKLVNNLLSVTALAASAEAFVLGAKAGLDPEIMLKVINTSSGRNSATLDKFPKSILPRTFDFGFKTELAYKDIKLCLEQAEALGIPMWVGSAVRQLWAYAVSQGAGPRDFTTIIQYIEAWAGVVVRPAEPDPPSALPPHRKD